jgi:hypothetical protein
MQARREKRNEDNLPELEKSLLEVLHPVSPRPEFVNGLKSRLLTKPESAVDGVEVDNMFHYTLLVIFGLFSGTILAVLGIRALIALLGALGIVTQMKEHIDQEQPGALRSTS